MTHATRRIPWASRSLRTSTSRPLLWSSSARSFATRLPVCLCCRRSSPSRRWWVGRWSSLRRHRLPRPRGPGPRAPAGKLGVGPSICSIHRPAFSCMAVCGRLPLPTACVVAGYRGGDRVAICAAGVSLAASGATAACWPRTGPALYMSWSSPRTRVHLEGRAVVASLYRNNSILEFPRGFP